MPIFSKITENSALKVSIRPIHYQEVAYATTCGHLSNSWALVHRNQLNRHIYADDTRL